MSDDMTLTVESVEPYGLFDTMIYFKGRDDSGALWRFAVDHRPARDIRYVLEARDCAASYDDRADFHRANPGVDDSVLDEPLVVEVPGWAVLGMIDEPVDTDTVVEALGLDADFANRFDNPSAH